MEIKLTYLPLVERCMMLSAYEGKDAVSDGGESLFDKIRITDRDKVLIRSYLVQGAHSIEAIMIGMLDGEGDYNNDDYVVWTTRYNSSRRRCVEGGGGFEKSASEALVSYAMSKWLENRLPDVSKSYERMFVDMSDAAIKILKVKAKPKRPE